MTMSGQVKALGRFTYYRPNLAHRRFAPWGLADFRWLMEASDVTMGTIKGCLPRVIWLRQREYWRDHRNPRIRALQSAGCGRQLVLIRGGASRGWALHQRCYDSTLSLPSQER